MADRQLRALSGEVAQQIRRAIEDRAVLVGGQSLAFWVARYDIPIYERFAAISMDADYLGDKIVVENLRSLPSSVVNYPRSDAITALVGNVQIIFDDESYMNVDVIHKVVGIKRKKVDDRSVDVEVDGVMVRVMHPLHVLASRAINFLTLQEKQTELGLMQMKLAVKVAHRYIAEVAQGMEGGQRVALKLIEEVVRLAKSSAGRFAKLNGIHFFDAIPYAAISSPNFRTHRLDRLIAELENAQPQKNRKPIDWNPVND